MENAKKFIPASAFLCHLCRHRRRRLFVFHVENFSVLLVFWAKFDSENWHIVYANGQIGTYILYSIHYSARDNFILFSWFLTLADVIFDGENEYYADATRTWMSRSFSAIMNMIKVKPHAHPHTNALAASAAPAIGIDCVGRHVCLMLQTANINIEISLAERVFRRMGPNV